MVIELAFVNFFKEKRGRKVISVEDIENFLPIHHGDYDEHKTYQVKWPHLPNKGSSSTEGLFEAKIFCLGADMEDLQHEAKMKGLKIPADARQVDRVDTNETDNAVVSKRGRKLKPISKCTAFNVPDPRMKKKKKLSTEDLTRNKRTLKTLDNYEDDLLKPDSSRKYNESALSDEKPRAKSGVNNDLPRDSDKEKDDVSVKKVPSQSSFCGVDERKSLKAKSKGIMEEQSGKEKVDLAIISVQKQLPSRSSTCGLDEPKSLRDEKLKAKSKEISKNGVLEELESKKDDLTAKLVKKQLPSRSSTCGLDETKPPAKGEESASDNEESNRDSSSEGSKGTVVLHDIEDADVCSPPPDLVGSFSRISKSLSNEVSKVHRAKRMARISSTSSESDFESYVSSDHEKSLYLNKIKKLEGQVKELTASNNKLLEELDLIKVENRRYAELNMKLTEKLVSAPVQCSSVFATPTKPSDALFTPTKPSNAFATPTHEPFEQDEDSAKTVNKATKRLMSPTTKSTKSNKKARKTEDPSECSIQDNTSLASLIFKALEGKTVLERDGKGKLHLGNAVYVSSNLFDDKLCKSTVSPNIALRDCMTNIYTDTEMAARSLDGGTPVKGSNEKKLKMTPAKREALLGLYRAKVMQQTGSSNPEFLNLSVKQGKNTIRYKLKEADKRRKQKQGNGNE